MARYVKDARHWSAGVFIEPGTPVYLVSNGALT
jgi:hypothetical protein